MLGRESLKKYMDLQEKHSDMAESIMPNMEGKIL